MYVLSTCWCVVFVLQRDMTAKLANNTNSNVSGQGNEETEKIKQSKGDGEKGGRLMTDE